MTANRSPAVQNQLPSRKDVLTALQCAFVAITVVTGLFKTNALPLAILAVGGLVFGIAHILSDSGKWFRISEQHRAYSPSGYFPNRAQYFVAIGWMPIVMIAGWLYLIPFPWPMQVIERGDGTLLYEQWPSMTRFNTFTDSVYNYTTDQSVAFESGHPLICSATTKDGFGVKARIGATLNLSFDGLRAAYAVGGNKRALEAAVRNELCTRFASTIHTYMITEVPMQLVVEAKTSEEKRGMNALGVKYSGIFQVGRLEVHATQP